MWINLTSHPLQALRPAINNSMANVHSLAFMVYLIDSDYPEGKIILWQVGRIYFNIATNGVDLKLFNNGGFAWSIIEAEKNC